MAQRMGGLIDVSTPHGTGWEAGTRSGSADDDLRRLFARELHDRLAQTLTTMLLDLENFKAEQVGREGVLRQMDSLQSATRDVLNNLRAMLYELRGATGVEEGFIEAVRLQVERFQQRTQIAADLVVLPGWPTRLPSGAALNLYRIIEEALTNARQHSAARSVHVVLQAHRENELSVTVADDGRGLEPEDTGPTGMGMVGMRERALFLGAQLRVETVVGSGTTVAVILPRENQ